jgi:hypothetical protein
MTRIAIRHTLSALAALALVSAFSGSPASAHEPLHHQWTHVNEQVKSMSRGTTRDLTAQKPQQKATTHYIPWMRGYSEGSDLRK